MASMQGGRCVSDSFRNIVDLNDQLVLSTSNFNHSTACWSNLLNPGRHDTGKSSSVNLDRVNGDELIIGKDLFAPTSSSSNRVAVYSYQPAQSGESGSNRVMKRVSDLSGSGSDYYPLNTKLCGAYMESSFGGLHSTSSNSYTSGIETHERLTHDLSLNNHGASSSSYGYLINNGDKSGSSLVSSAKRTAPEGGHMQLYLGAGSRSHLQAENYMQHTLPASQNASGSITTVPSPMEWSFTSQQEQRNRRIGIDKREAYSEGSRAQMYANGSSSTRLPVGNIVQHTVLTSQDASESIITVASPLELSLTSQQEQLSVRIGIEERETYSEFFPPPNITDIAQNAAENIGERLNFGQLEPNLFDFTLTDTALRPSGSGSGNHPSMSLLSIDSSLIINSCNPSSRSHEIRVPENTGSMIPSHWRGPLDPQSGRPLKSLRFSGGRATAFGDAQSSRITLLQDSPALNSASGNTRPSESLQPSSRSGYNLRMQNISTGGTPPQNWIVPNQQGLTQYSPQFSYHSLLPDYRNQRDHFPVIPIPSSLGEGSIPPFSSQGCQNQSLRSALLIGDLPGPTSRQRGSAVEARQRLVRQVRNTAQRGNNRRAQNITIEVAEHDRHRDMRLDIDNMSYEELLALEERIGYVCTGLSDEVIMRSMKQRKLLPVKSSSTSEPCCICQEEFVAGDEIGATVCEHEFHFKCIKEWLSQKNVCPICKKTALNT